MKKNCISLVIGLCAGIFGGLVGLGGGLIMIPLMCIFLQMSQHKAHGTSLVALVFTGISGAFIYGLNGSVDCTAAAALAVTAVFTAHFGARYAHTLAEWKLKKYFGFFLIFVSLLLLLKPHLPAVAVFTSFWPQMIILLLTGAATGFLSGMMGVGGGTIMVPVMVLLAGFGQHLAQGTSLLVMVPAGALGAFTHWKLGNVKSDILYGLIPGIVLGAYLGGHFAHFIGDNALRLVFTVILIVLGLRYVQAGSPE